MRVKENTQKGTVASQELSGILLDSGGSRETMIPQAPQFMSPALADLKGLDFCFETDNTNSSGGGVIDFKFKGKANTPAALSVEKKEGDDGLMKFVRAARLLQELMNDLTACQKHPEAVLYNFHDNSKPSSSPELSTTKEAMKNEVTSKPTNDPTAPPQEPTLKAIKAAPATPSKPVFGDSFKGYREQPYSPFSPDSKEPTSEESKEYVDAPEQVTPSKKEKPQNTITSMFLKQAQRQALKKETAEENVFLKAPKSPKRPTKVFAVAAPTQFHNVLAESIHAPPPPMELFNAPTVFAQSPPAPLFFAQQRPALPNAFRQFNKAKTIGVQPYLPTKLAPNVSECSSQLSELPLSYELRQPTLGLKQDSANTVLAGICGPHTIDPAPFQGRAKKATDNTQKESKTTPIKPSEDSPPLSQLYSPTSHFQGTDENLRPSMPRVLGNQPFQSRKPSQPR
ncbi:hypothetical protein N7478_006883 [Penicillium angulare]|uniref:uncharacterized protein n=1 Tax=Penicillium angulare TaxID=116970 RepID=UPI00253FA11D|nr:uncharacterized protein N7478_006883 [Penicillium angulare]KAJ5281511.1 hypothetical protein N7478_006883 [Penicillium angulare]